MPVLDCFPTPIWSTESPNKDDVNNEIIDMIPKLRASSIGGATKSNSGGWHSDMLDITTFPNLQKSVFGFVGAIQKELDIKPEAVISCESLWINVNLKHHYNRTHTHPNSMISGVYYVTVPKNSGDIVFVDPRTQASVLLLPTTKNNKYTGREIRFHPQPGTLVAFPSWLEHYVDTSQTEEERISVAFNMAIMMS